MSSNMVIATSSASTYTSGSQSSPKFKRVTQLKSGKWDSWISFKCKTYRLGTYDVEEEAAKAYDRAAIKLQRCELNFPLSKYTIQEMRFQGQYSEEDILKMIKDKTYDTKFSVFLADQSLAREPMIFRNEGISYELLFRKELTQTDVTDFMGFHIPKACAIQHFPSLETTGEGEKKSIQLTFDDKHCRSWTFRYSFWKSRRVFVFTKGWRQFVRMNSLKEKDYIYFYRCNHQRGNDGDKKYIIDVHQGGLESYRLLGHGTDNMNHVSSDVEIEEMEEEDAATQVMLFGVGIGRGRGATKRNRTDE